MDICSKTSSRAQTYLFFDEKKGLANSHIFDRKTVTICCAVSTISYDKRRTIKNDGMLQDNYDCSIHALVCTRLYRACSFDRTTTDPIVAPHAGCTVIRGIPCVLLCNFKKQDERRGGEREMQSPRGLFPSPLLLSPPPSVFSPSLLLLSPKRGGSFVVLSLSVSGR